MEVVKELKAVTTIPFATPTEVVLTPGYHLPTGVYLHLPRIETEGLPQSPNRGMVVAALRHLWRPWEGYRFASAEDRAAMLAAIIGGVCRVGLETAPGVFLDAPVQGAGKTKAAEALAVLVRGYRGVTPFTEGQNAEAEMTKRLVGLLLEGAPSLLVDNVVGVFDSAVLAAFITSGRLDERMLGGNAWFRGEGRVLVIATGNNASLSRDLGRRLLRVRIDPGVECPQGQEFHFDPVVRAMGERLAIARAVITVVQAFQSDGAPRLGRGDCGFPEWAALVRSCVLWLQREGMSEEADVGVLGDPARSILEGAVEDDPDTTGLHLLLVGLRSAFGADLFRARDVLALWDTGGEGAASLVREGLEVLVHRRQNISARTIGDVLRYRRDRLAGGLVLRACGKDRDGVALWMVCEA